MNLLSVDVSAPHMGSAYPTVAADAVARYQVRSFTIVTRVIRTIIQGYSSHGKCLCMLILSVMSVLKTEALWKTWHATSKSSHASEECVFVTLLFWHCK